MFDQERHDIDHPHTDCPSCSVPVAFGRTRATLGHVKFGAAADHPAWRRGRARCVPVVPAHSRQVRCPHPPLRGSPALARLRTMRLIAERVATALS